jgi:hypothetical protein
MFVPKPAHHEYFAPTGKQTNLQMYILAWSQRHINPKHFLGLIRCILSVTPANAYVGLARTVHIRCIYVIFGKNITKCTVIYNV